MSKPISFLNLITWPFILNQNLLARRHRSRHSRCTQQLCQNLQRIPSFLLTSLQTGIQSSYGTFTSSLDWSCPRTPQSKRISPTQFMAMITGSLIGQIQLPPKLIMLLIQRASNMPKTKHANNMASSTTLSANSKPSVIAPFHQRPRRSF